MTNAASLPFLKTPAAADALGVQYWTLHQLIRQRSIPAPAKDSSGDFVWSPEDLDRARQALAARRPARKESPHAS
jgi:hypothetical protein